MTATKVTPAELAGIPVKKRQGGNSTNPSSVGTTNYDTSLETWKIQTGVITVTADGMTITFPEAFSQSPIMFGNQFGNVSANCYVRWNSSTTTTASVTIVNPAGSAITGQQISWMAVGPA